MVEMNVGWVFVGIAATLFAIVACYEYQREYTSTRFCVYCGTALEKHEFTNRLLKALFKGRRRCSIHNSQKMPYPKRGAFLYFLLLVAIIWVFFYGLAMRPGLVQEEISRVFPLDLLSLVFLGLGLLGFALYRHYNDQFLKERLQAN